jgi:hypothetical protein
MTIALSMTFGSLLCTLLAASAQASETLNCKTALNSFRGYNSIKIEQSGNDVQISGLATGGMAHFVSVFGPFTATQKLNGDAVIFEFQDQFGQTGHVSVLTTAIAGKLIQTASSDYGMFAGQMTCN